jgi:hypothetical protein
MTTALLPFAYILSSCAAEEVQLLCGELRDAGTYGDSGLHAGRSDSPGHRSSERTFAASDGDFEFRHLQLGLYELRVVDEAGKVITRRNVDVRPQAAPLLIALPERKAQAPGGTVSIARLRHRPVKRAFKAMAAGRRFMERNHYEQALVALTQAARIDPEYPEAQANPGASLLKSHRPAQALRVLQRAVEPRSGS